MEWIRNWAMQVAGITVLAAICDVIMPRGNMQKYVRMVMGLVLIIALVKPLIGINGERFGAALSDSRARAAEMKNSMTERERNEVLRVYRAKLAESIDNELRAADICAAEIDVAVEEENDGRFGDITEVTVTLGGSAGNDAADSARTLICKKFGVSRDNIRITDG